MRGGGGPHKHGYKRESICRFAILYFCVSCHHVSSAGGVEKDGEHNKNLCNNFYGGPLSLVSPDCTPVAVDDRVRFDEKRGFRKRSGWEINDELSLVVGRFGGYRDDKMMVQMGMNNS